MTQQAQKFANTDIGWLKKKCTAESAVLISEIMAEGGTATEMSGASMRRIVSVISRSDEGIIVILSLLRQVLQNFICEMEVHNNTGLNNT